MNRKGLYRGGWLATALFQLGSVWVIALKAYSCTGTDIEKFVEIPLLSFLFTSLVYPVDTVLRRLQFQSFLGQHRLMYTKGQVWDVLKKEKVRNFYAGYPAFFLKTLMLAVVQYRIWWDLNK